jgi:ketosteroid isomerase-like protein
MWQAQLTGRGDGPMTPMEIARRYEAALFAGRMDEVASYFTDDAKYWVAGPDRIGGTWIGPEAIVRAFSNREFGLGEADWSYEDVWRDWRSSGDDMVTVEIRERSFLKSAPDDVMDQRTCVVIRFRGEKICDMREYTDAGIYLSFLARHPELPKFAKTNSPEKNAATSSTR